MHLAIFEDAFSHGKEDCLELYSWSGRTVAEESVILIRVSARIQVSNSQACWNLGVEEGEFVSAMYWGEIDPNAEEDNLFSETYCRDNMNLEAQDNHYVLAN